MINAMGPLQESVLDWSGQQALSLRISVARSNANFWISCISKFIRYITPIVVLTAACSRRTVS
jgi:hypothetical protein